MEKIKNPLYSLPAPDIKKGVFFQFVLIRRNTKLFNSVLFSVPIEILFFGMPVK